MPTKHSTKNAAVAEEFCKLQTKLYAMLQPDTPHAKLVALAASYAPLGAADPAVALRHDWS